MRRFLITAAVLLFVVAQAAVCLAGDVNVNMPGARGQGIPLPPGKTITVTLKVGITNPGTSRYSISATQEAVGGKMTRVLTQNLVVSGPLCQSTVNLNNTDKIKIECNYTVTDPSKDAKWAYRNDSKGNVLLYFW